jgi:hypothetical protein
MRSNDGRCSAVATFFQTKRVTSHVLIASEQARRVCKAEGTRVSKTGDEHDASESELRNAEGAGALLCAYRGATVGCDKHARAARST